MSKVLIKWKDNWADEADFYGFVIDTKENWEEFKSLCEAYNSSFSMTVGTNEQIDYSDGKDLLSRITISEINDNEVQIMKKLFGHSYIGVCSWGHENFYYTDRF